MIDTLSRRYCYTYCPLNSRNLEAKLRNTVTNDTDLSLRKKRLRVASTAKENGFDRSATASREHRENRNTLSVPVPGPHGGHKVNDRDHRCSWRLQLRFFPRDGSTGATRPGQAIKRIIERSPRLGSSRGNPARRVVKNAREERRRRRGGTVRQRRGVVLVSFGVSSVSSRQSFSSTTCNLVAPSRNFNESRSGHICEFAAIIVRAEDSLFGKLIFAASTEFLSNTHEHCCRVSRLLL